MSDLTCRKTMMRCQTPGMCAPYGGCQPQAVTESVFKADYAALEAECERMRQALTKIHDRCEAFVGDDSGMQVHSVEVLMDIAARGLSAKPCRES